MKIVLCSIYHPVDTNKHNEFNGVTSTLLSSLPNDTTLIFGHDINCNVGTKKTSNQT